MEPDHLEVLAASEQIILDMDSVASRLIEADFLTQPLVDTTTSSSSSPSSSWSSSCSSSSSSSSSSSWMDTDLGQILKSVVDEELLLGDDYLSAFADPEFCSSSLLDLGSGDETRSSGESDQPFKCPFCPKSFGFSSRLERHLTVHQVKQHQCQICLKFFSRPDVLKIHVKKTHHRNLPQDDGGHPKRHFPCPECSAVLSSQHHLDRHIRSHRSRVGHFECDVCKKVFAEKHKFQMHQKHHLRHTKKFQCPDCGHGFLQAEFLARHRLTHSREKPHRCPDCGQSFSQIVNLKQHRVRKHGQGQVKRLHECGVCGKMFLTSSELKNHSLYHDRIRKFRCSFCTSAFLEKRHLDRHLRRIHSHVRDFMCVSCNKTFFEKYELNHHLRVSSCARNRNSPI